MNHRQQESVQREYRGFVYDMPDSGEDPAEEGFVKVRIVVSADGMSDDTSSSSGKPKRKKRKTGFASCKTCVYRDNLCKGACVLLERSRDGTEESCEEQEEIV